MTRQVTEPFVQEAFGQYSCGAHFWLSRLAPTYKAPGWLVVTRCLWKETGGRLVVQNRMPATCFQLT